MNPALLPRLVLLLLLVVLGLPGRTRADGFPLPLKNAGTWGQSATDLLDDIQGGLKKSGFLDAVTVAGDFAKDVAKGKVPVIDDLAGTIEGDARKIVADSMTQATAVTRLFGKMDIGALQKLYVDLQAKVTTPQQFAFTIPDGRLVFRRDVTDISLCAVIAAPGGTRVTLGISNGSQLGGNPSERFANPTTEPVLFADIAVGYSNFQVRRKLLAPVVPGIDPGVSLQATTYFKVHDQWVQLRFAGNDPQALTLKLQFVVGVRAGVDAELQIEAEGQAMLVVEVKPAMVASMLVDITRLFRDGLGSATPASLKADPAAIAPVLKQVFAYLKNAEDHGAGLGTVSLVLAADGGVGLGIWDTGIDLASVGSQITVSVPLETLVAAGTEALGVTLDSGLKASNQLVSLFEAMAEGRLDALELDRQRAQLEIAARKLGDGLLVAFLGHIQQVQLSQEMGIYALGDIGQVADQTVPVLVTTVDIPVGQVLVDGAAGVPRFVKAVSDTAKAVTWLAEAAIDAGLKGSNPLSLGKTVTPPSNPGTPTQRPRGKPPTPPSIAEWESIATGVLDDVTFSIQLGTLKLDGASLGNVVRLAAGAAQVTESLLRGAVEAAVAANEKPMLDALRAAPNQIKDEAKDALVRALQTLTVGYVASVGASGTVGAEVAAGIGGRIGFDARFKASLILLALGDPNYQDPHGTLLAGFDIPVEVSASAGVSLGEGAEFTAEGGFTLGSSLANLTLRDWGNDLPAPAGLTVAGFEVIDFAGTNRQDGVITGNGWIVLPMGGLVRADRFLKEPSGKVRDAYWTGVLELGPLGDVTVAGGRINNDSLSGLFNLQVGASYLKGDFLLRNNGLLFGNASGNLDIGGISLANVAVSLSPDGSFVGTAQSRIGPTYSSTTVRLSVGDHPAASLSTFSGLGDVNASLDLQADSNGAAGTATVRILGQPVYFGVVIGDGGSVDGSASVRLDTPWGIGLDADLALDGTGVHGSGYMMILGSRFESTNLRVGKNGLLTGTFRGTLSVDGQSLAVESLEISGDKLEGRTSLDIAGQRAVETVLTVDRGGVFGRFASNLSLFGAGTTETWIRLGDHIEVYGLFDVGFLGSLESALRGQVLAGLSSARTALDNDRKKLADNRKVVSDLNDTLAKLFTDIQQEKQKARDDAQRAVTYAEGVLADANAQLDKAIAAVSAVSGTLAAQLADASAAARDAASKLNAAQGSVNNINGQIAALDAWFNGLNDAAKFFARLGYLASRATLVASRDVANAALGLARTVFNAANATLQGLQQQLKNAQALLDDKTLKEQIVAQAESDLTAARRNLDSIISAAIDPRIDPRYIAVSLARDGYVLLVDAAQKAIDATLTVLGDVSGLIDQINAQGEASVVKVTRVGYHSRLGDLDLGYVQLTVDALVAGQPREFTLSYNLKTGRNQEYVAAAATRMVPALYPAVPWTVAPWTGDETSGIMPGRTLWAYRFGSPADATVATVPVPGILALAPAVPGRFSVGGFTSIYSGDANDLTAGNDGSAAVAQSFLWGENPGTVTFEGLTPGRSYRATFLSVGWDEAPVTRTATFSGAAGNLAVAQNQYGNNKGLRVEHVFKPTGSTYAVTISPAGVETFHLYALALGVEGDAPGGFADWKQVKFGADAGNAAVSDANADPDGDGIPNFAEYALRTDPRLPNAPRFAPPTATTLPGGIPARSFTFPYQAGARDVVYRLRHTGNLRDWSDAYRLDMAAGTESPLPGVSAITDPVNQTVTVLVSDPALNASPSFWTLTVEKR